MKGLIENIKAYFIKKDKGEVLAAPEEMCPVCWGHNEWDGQYFELIRDKHLTPNSKVYDSFISKIVDKHVATAHKHENKYVCTTCDKTIA